MSTDDSEAISQLCARRPLAVRVMRARGLDPASRRTLGACCFEAGLELHELLAELGRAEDAVAGAWRSRPISELLDHVLRTYHRPLASELDAVAVMIDDARPGDEPAMEVWSELQRLLDELRTDLEQHMTKEERVLFPWLRGRAETAAAPIRAMQLEHGDTLQLLLAIHATAARMLASEPGDAASRLVGQLDELEAWLCEHIHLENNELFRRALDAT